MSTVFPEARCAAIADANTKALEQMGAIASAVQACRKVIRLYPDAYCYMHARERLV